MVSTPNQISTPFHDCLWLSKTQVEFRWFFHDDPWWPQDDYWWPKIPQNGLKLPQNDSRGTSGSKWQIEQGGLFFGDSILASCQLVTLSLEHQNILVLDFEWGFFLQNIVPSLLSNNDAPIRADDSNKQRTNDERSFWLPQLLLSLKV